MSEETRFCSKCGFLLSGVAEIVANEGIVGKQKTGLAGSPSSRRRRGALQGIFIFLLSFLVVPLIAILTLAVGAEPYAVVISAILLGVGGLLRIAYALMFESPIPDSKSIDLEFAVANHLGGERNQASLPAAESRPASAYTSPTGVWRDTNDLQATPASVTDSTTKLLEKERDQ
jgi:hypothetical protein